MIGKIGQNCSVLPLVAVLALIANNSAQAAQNVLGNPSLIEVFITTDLTVVGVIDSLSESGKLNLQVFELDGIQRIEARLSKGLSADPDKSRRVVLKRFQRLHEEDRKLLRNAAMGLVKAAQYGVDRHPAIVFDGKVVVYGIPNIRLALFQYQQWQEGQKP